MSMVNIVQLLTEHMDIWTAADTEKKSGRGRASGNAGNVYGIKKLRELILELAVRGKLVSQDRNDEPASELLKCIQAERAKLIAEGKLKKEKPLTPIGEDEKLFELPKGWDWKRLPETYYSISPRGNQLKGSEIKEEGKFPVVDQGQTFISGYTDNQDLLIEIPHPLIVFGDHTTNLKLIDFDFVAGADGTKLLAPILIYPKFYFYYLNSYKLENRGYARHFKVLNDNLIAIPPIAEQHRIVAKVDELMALCDQLEQQHTNAQEAHETLVSQLLATLGQSQNVAEFKANWQRIYAHFDVLFNTDASIDALKQTLLQLAVMGKLVPQDPNDEPARELVKRIQAEKAKLIAEGKLKKEKQLALISEDEKPYETPTGWTWVRLNELLTKIGAGSTPLGGKQVYVQEGVPFLRSQNVWDDGLRLDDVAFITPDTHKKMSGTHVYSGDLLFNITGASIGRCAIVPDDFLTGNVSQHVTIIRLVSTQLLRFMHLVLISQHVQQTVMDVQVGVSREGLSIGKLGQFVIPIPPLSEQYRIVAKVNVLMALCDQLKTRIQQANQQQQAIANALVEQVVA